MQKNEISRFYLWTILADLKWNKGVDTFGTNDVIDAALRVGVTVDCL